MPVVKLRGSSTPDVMKSEWGNDSLNTFTRRATGKEPFLSLPRTADNNPLQWIQLLNALDQQDHPGWPLLSPLKVQLQKCDKCSGEFCSTINYRRHIRVHRRSLNVVKDFHKNRDLLGAFWDKLSLDKAKEVLSFKDVTLEEVAGSSIIRALTSFIRKPEFYALPQLYVKAGSALLDIIQARPSGLPISSLELFSILDDASERTFLCAGTAESIQKYVFDGEAGKIGLEMKNLVACTCFLVEQKLVKAWLADKDAEALRCQKLLVEEVEADQKRQAELLERKRQKKLRQKEQKIKEQANCEKEDLKETISGTLDGPSSAETSSPLKVESDSSSNELETPVDHAISPLESVQSSITEDDTDTEAQNGFGCEHADSGTSLTVERKTAPGSGHRLSRWQVAKSQRGGRNGFHDSQNTQVLKIEPLQKRGGPRDPRSAPVVNGNKVWTRKPKSENDGENLKSRLQKEAVNQTDQNCEVMIGSISVTLGDRVTQQQSGSMGETLEHYMPEHPMPNSSAHQEKPIKTDSVQGGASNRSMVKLWRPVSRHETRGPLPVQSGSGYSREEAITTGKDDDRTKPSESCVRSCASGSNTDEWGNDSHPPMEESAQPEGLMFSSHAAKAFLSERWKEAISADHVRLVLTTQSDPPGTPDTENDNQLVVRPPDSQRGSNVGNSEKLPGDAVAFESSTTGKGTSKSKFRAQPEKAKTKYIPKQRTVT